MQSDTQALRALSKIALARSASQKTARTACRIVRRSTGASEALLVYAQDYAHGTEYLATRDGQKADDFPPSSYVIIQRQLASLGKPFAFHRNGKWVEPCHCGGGKDENSYLAFLIPTTESASELCLLRGPWPAGAQEHTLSFMESVLLALSLFFERLLNAERATRHKEQLAALSNAAQALTQTEDMRAALTDLASVLSTISGYEYVTITVYDPEQQRYVLRVLGRNRWASSKFADAWVGAFNPDKPDRTSRQMLESPEIILHPDLHNDERFSDRWRTYYRETQLRSAAILPILFQEEVLGWLSFTSYKPHTFVPTGRNREPERLNKPSGDSFEGDEYVSRPGGSKKKD